ncbi:hypothetical protein AVM11_17890 [Sphingomonas melonis TY]|uniref:O-antigen ligase-related domain-containing protein n=1 Tax=Sphingomonas melonis TY TaxID=621456 RepID=A0A175Y3I4_9SPHN|nr:hypothetical protein BJP26_13970 [Sphingomonas melonis TY]KZB94995.1 hypothetical protein AVM11_17890 [Sphingomonas melonis TY]
MWIAGGSARADVLGQPVVRGVAAAVMVTVILLRERRSFRDLRSVVLLVGAAIVLALVQLVPLPPSIWRLLPGRAILEDGAALVGADQPWRPWSMSPGATFNAAASLLVPTAVLLLFAGLKTEEREKLPGVLLLVIAASMFVGLIQFSGVLFANPFINETPGEVAGSFANRNHFALFMAIGCLIAPVWTFSGARRAYWRMAAGGGLIVLFLLSILASGSRAGLVLGLVGMVMGMALAWRGIRREMRGFPRWVAPVAAAGFIVLVAVFVALSIAVGRAASIDRAVSIDAGGDMRARAFPTIVAMIRQYFPAGSGLGAFDPVFRIREPLALLKPTYLNHAHNDLLEIVLDAGLPGLLLLLTGLMWCIWTGFRAWWRPADPFQLLPRLGSAMLLLVVLASAVDYPARTPMMMALIVLAGAWLSIATSTRGRTALPALTQHL